MNGNFSVGNHVKIQTRFHGRYHGKTGIVIENPAKVSWNNDFTWIRVRFDSPFVCGDTEIKEDIFQKENLILLDEP